VAASADVVQTSVVSTGAVAYTPQVVATVTVPSPHVDAIATLGATTFAGGSFDTITQGGRSYPRSHLVAFNRTTGAVSTTFSPQIAGGQVWAVATDAATNSVYVGGAFKTVNGATRPALVKLNATTGVVDTNFRPPFAGGQVNDLEVITLAGVRRLVVAGSSGRKLMSLNPATGRDDGYFTSVVSDPVPEAWGGVSVYRFAINPARTRLVATGNFLKIDGSPRSKFFMLTLGNTGDSLASWYYPGFAKPCSSTAPRRIANLQGVDWSPDGTAFTITATGQIPARTTDIWYHRLGDANRANTTVCDGAGRFNLVDATKPEWINYTGGDSVWTVSDTGAAVYVAGHFKWLDNPDGWASKGIGDKTSGASSASRRGIGAIDPATGLADGWNPGLTATRLGGKALVPDSNGLWIGNDATRFNGEAHYGLAYAPIR
jgi:hypothetical protein